MHYIQQVERIQKPEQIVSPAVIREHSRIDSGCDTLLLQRLIYAAVDYCEGVTRRAIGNQRITLIADKFDTYELSHPATAIESVEYYDDDNALQTLNAAVYYINKAQIPATIDLMPNQAWPSTYNRPDAIKITYTAGDIPDSVQHAIIMLVAHWYETREAVIVGQSATPQQVPLGVEAMLYPHRVYRL